LTPTLETPRLRLREYTYEDLDDLAAMFADAELMRYYSHPKSPEESLAWIEWNLGLYEQHGFGLWVMESLGTSEFVGDCGLTPQTVDGIPTSRWAGTQNASIGTRGSQQRGPGPAGTMRSTISDFSD